jgi:hypothetical protein
MDYYMYEMLYKVSWGACQKIRGLCYVFMSGHSASEQLLKSKKGNEASKNGRILILVKAKESNSQQGLHIFMSSCPDYSTSEQHLRLIKGDESSESRITHLG